jgi:hypothetical protein
MLMDRLNQFCQKSLTRSGANSVKGIFLCPIQARIAQDIMTGIRQRMAAAMA